jgi:cell division protein FtsB
VPKKPVTNRPAPKARPAATASGSRFDRAGDESRAHAETERGNWLRGIRFSGFTVLMLAVIVLGVVVLAPNLKAYIEQRQQIAALQQTVDDRADQIDQLTAERQRWNDSTYVTTQARDRLFYANPGEISFIVIDDVDPALLGDTETPVSDTLTETDIDWGQALLGSVMSSGLADVTPGPGSTGGAGTTPGTGGSSPAPTP